jgi:phosphatidylserine decarboxylase
MERISLVSILLFGVVVFSVAFLFWRYVWFFRNPPRIVPAGTNIVSPADGTVVYVQDVEPGKPVIVVKQGMSATIRDIAREDIRSSKVLIGVFMSPLDVHYNRAPLGGVVESIRNYPCDKENLHMGIMHFRSLFGLKPYYTNSRHILENERTVTRIRGNHDAGEIGCYVVQIAAKNVNCIESYVPEGGQITKGEIFGMIKIGSQVDTILPNIPGMQIKVRPGDKVRAGESILVEW